MFLVILVSLMWVSYCTFGHAQEDTYFIYIKDKSNRVFKLYKIFL